MNPSREPDYTFCIVGGVVKAVYRIDDWKQPLESERVGRLERRWAFSGANDAEMERRYVGVDVTEYFPRGAANPVRYVNC